MVRDDLVLVGRKDLTELLNYTQEREEEDVIENPEYDTDHHIVYVIRRLREQAESEDGFPLWEGL